MRRLEARVSPEEAGERLEDEACADEQHERERDFRDDERPERAVVLAARSSAAATAKRVLRVDGRGPPRGSCATDETHGDGDRDAECDDAPVDAQTVELGQTRCGERPDRAHAEHSEREAEERPRSANEHTLGDGRDHDVPTARAKGRAHGDLPLAMHAAREEERGDVGRGDQQHHAHGAEEEHERLAHRLRTFGDERRDTDVLAAKLRILVDESREHAAKLGLRGGDGRARREPAEHQERVVSALSEAIGCEPNRTPDVRVEHVRAVGNPELAAA